MIGAWLGKLVGSLGGPPMAGALVAGGLLVGGIVGAVAGGTREPAAGPDDAVFQIYPCPETGPVLAEAPGSQRVLVTGRTDDSAWLRIHFPGPGRSEAWVQAEALDLEGPLDDLEVADCGSERTPEEVPTPGGTLTAIGSFEPTPTPTPEPTPTPTPSPTPSPTPAPTRTAAPTPAPTVAPTATPTPTPTPAPTPDTTGPALSGATADVSLIWEQAGTYSCGPTAVTISITATDPSGVQVVVLEFRKPGAASFVGKAMSPVGNGSTYVATLSTSADQIAWNSNDPTLEYRFVAYDAFQNQSVLPSGPRAPLYSVEVKYCVVIG